MELRKCQFSLPGAPFYLQYGLDCSHRNETGNSQKHQIFTVSLSVLQSHGICGRLPMNVSLPIRDKPGKENVCF